MVTIKSIFTLIKMWAVFVKAHLMQQMMMSVHGLRIHLFIIQSSARATNTYCAFVTPSTAQKKPVTTMLSYPWKCTVLHCNHLGNTWKPLVLMTRHFDYCLARVIIQVLSHQHQWFPGVSQVVTM